MSVHSADGHLFGGEAAVVLEAGTYKIHLEREKNSPFYVGNVPVGTYQLNVVAENQLSPERRLTIIDSHMTVSSYIGNADWPFYRYGENAVPFEPREDLIAVCFDSRPPEEETALAAIREITKSLNINPFDLRAKDEAHACMAASGSIWIFSISDFEDRTTIGFELLRLAGDHARVGIPTDVNTRQVKVLDNRYVVRFRDHIEPGMIINLVHDVSGRIIRDKFTQARNIRVIEFSTGGYRDHLAIVEEWYQQNLLVYGEPDLLAEMVDDTFPADPPNDPTYPNQANLTLQNVNEAWRCLNEISTSLTLGSPSVYVASLDRGVDIDHSDIGGYLTDGTLQMAQCYDFSGMRTCSVADYQPNGSHGMGVYGIISARTNNALNIAGIAPNVHHIAMERPRLTSCNYPDVLLWSAGFATGNSSVGWPEEPISPGADIITCSHGTIGLAMSGIMDDTLTYLSVSGRSGRGTLVIYSAGNDNSFMAGRRVWATHASTMAISNSDQPGGVGIEVLNNTSNFGPEIDICAQGTGSPSLDHVGGEQVFGSTSAAAPTVAAAAALMLSVNGDLTWDTLRELLRDTAVLIDGSNIDPVGKWVNGFSQWYGFGRLDVGAAVLAASKY